MVKLDEKTIDLLRNIQDRLEKLWPLLEFYNSNTELIDYSAPVFAAHVVVEEMIVLLAYERGFNYNGHQFTKDEINDCVSNGMITPFMFVRKGGLDDIPQEVIGFLKEIQILRNKAVHPLAHSNNDPNISYGEAVFFASFLVLASNIGEVYHHSNVKGSDNPV